MSKLVLLLPLLCLLLFTQNIFAAPRVDGDPPISEGDEETDVVDGEEEIATTETHQQIKVPPQAYQQDETHRGPHAKPIQSTKKVYRATVKIWPNTLQEQSDYDITDATALCYDNQFDLILHLGAPFKGYIYPYHHFKSCHLLTGASDRAVSLRIDQDSCGMDVSHGVEQGILSFLQYTMMLQWDKDVIGKMDRKIQVTCNREDTNHRLVEFSSDQPSNPDLYMEIETQSEDESDSGESDIYDVARVGETVDLSVTLLSSTANYDVRILSCSAYDGLRGNVHTIGTYHFNTTGAMQYGGLKELYKDGCPTDKKWLAPFEKTSTGLKTVLSSTLKVFRFPSSGIVVIDCKVQVCKDKCKEVNCETNLEAEKSETEPESQEITLFRPIMVRLGAGMPNEHGHHDEEVHSAHGLPTASFIAGLIGMGFVCAIVCVFMYRRFKKGSEKDYKMQYNVEKNKDEVAPLKVTTAATAE